MKRTNDTPVTLRCFSGALQFDAILHNEDGAYWGEAPDLPGCFSAGDTLDEVKADMVQAVELHIFGLLKRKLEEDAAARRPRRPRRQAPFPPIGEPREAVLA
jgi:predicted RNase H-like HicB family nuclease